MLLDCALGIKLGAGRKCGLWTVYIKTANRKVKLRETESRLVSAPCLTHKHNSFGWSRGLFSPTLVWSWMGKKGYAAAQGT